MTANKEKKGCLGVLFPFINFLTGKTPEKLPYRLRDDFLSPAEYSFYKVLVLLGGSRLTIQSKVRLADIFFVPNLRGNVGFFNRIANKHLDFLACDSVTMKPLFGVELDDSSHEQNKRRERDRFLDEVFNVAGMKLLRFPVRREYNPREIEAQIAPFLQDKSIPPAQAQPTAMHQPADAIPICPKCGIPMVLRTATQGEFRGRLFYGCQNFPRCREIKSASKDAVPS
jgi:hypothetical protein